MMIITIYNNKKQKTPNLEPRLKKQRWPPLTRYPGDASVQPGAAGPHLVGPPLAQGPHGELEGAPGHVLAAVLDVDGVRAHLRGNEAHAVGAVVAMQDLRLLGLAPGAGHLGRHLPRPPALTWERGGGGWGWGGGGGQNPFHQHFQAGWRADPKQAEQLAR